MYSSLLCQMKKLAETAYSRIELEVKSERSYPLAGLSVPVCLKLKWAAEMLSTINANENAGDQAACTPVFRLLGI